MPACRGPCAQFGIKAANYAFDVTPARIGAIRSRLGAGIGGIRRSDGRDHHCELLAFRPFEFSCRRRADHAARGVRFAVEVSTDLRTWTTAVGDTEVAVSPGPGEAESVRLHIPMPDGDPDSLHLRVRAWLVNS